ncbi:MAG: DEAD/DEAH box helicase family protein [Candidatus Omnitrophota bacterium]|nr:DEAD/DEAH box helicase family protein [Candidatus Omnitrophota bacterium]
MIDKQLRQANWDIENKNQVTTEETAKVGRADYILKDRRGRGLAVVEAKRFSVDPVAAKQQALQYAESIKIDFIFLSNGEDIYFWDYKYRPEQKVPTFFSQRDLEKLQNLRLDRKPLSVVQVPEKYFKGGEWRTLRPYQKEAMQLLDKNLEANRRKMLLAMATGTGKTDTIALYLKRLFDANLISRVLFLVDRIALGIQAKEVFDEILSDYPSSLLYGGKPKDESSIIISTLPTLYSQLDQLTSGYFDIVISDEAHRSIFGIYNAVLSHFDAIRIGLTATPSSFIDRNTYKLFDCWDEREEKGRPTFLYSIRRGIKEGYLAGYNIIQIDTKVSLEGIKYEGDDFDSDELERRVNVPARNEQVAKTFRDEEDKRDLKNPRKTIVYAVTKKHAAQLAYYFNQVYPEFKGRYAEIITSDTEDPSGAIRRFKLEGLPIIAVSVGMMDTGIDAPMVENLIMVRPTKSPILYQQMRGRGSRLYPKIKKTSFRIYDFAGVTRHFNDESFDPYSEFTKTKTGIPWGTEMEDVTDEEKEVINRLFVQIPETAPENIDVVIKRSYIEIGSGGERIDADEYQIAWEKEIQELAKTEPLIEKINKGKELSNEELGVLSEKLNSPKFYFNEANLRDAYNYPPGTINEFIKTALGTQELPTEEQLYENRINDLFESWLVEKKFTSEQVKILRLVKSQYIARQKPIEISIFNEPVFKNLGGLNHVLKIFDDSLLKSSIEELNNSIFIAK